MLHNLNELYVIIWCRLRHFLTYFLCFQLVIVNKLCIYANDMYCVLKKIVFFLFNNPLKTLVFGISLHDSLTGTSGQIRWIASGKIV